MDIESRTRGGDRAFITVSYLDDCPATHGTSTNAGARWLLETKRLMGQPEPGFWRIKSIKEKAA